MRSHIELHVRMNRVSRLTHVGWTIVPLLLCASLILPASALSQVAALSRSDANGGSARQPLPEELLTVVPPAVARITAIGPYEQTIGQWSGFFVRSSGVLVTSYQAIAGAVRLTVELPSGERFKDVSLIAADRRRDLTLLKIPVRRVPYLDLERDNGTLVGDPVYVVSSSAGQRGRVQEGNLVARRAVEGVSVLEIDTTVPGRSSGAPVVNRRGKVIGVATSSAVRDSGSARGLVVPVEYVRRVLRAGGTPRPFRAAILSPLPRVERELYASLGDTASATAEDRPTSGRRWFLILEDWNVKIYVDRGSYEPVTDDVYSVWTRWENNPDFSEQLGTGGSDYAAGLERTLYDCRSIRSRTMTTMLFNWAGEVIQRYDKPAKWEFPLPGSVGEAIAAEICTAAALAEAGM